MVDEETGKHVNCPFEKKEAMYNEMLSRFDKQLEKFDVKFEELNSFKNRVIGTAITVSVLCSGLALVIIELVFKK